MKKMLLLSFLAVSLSGCNGYVQPIGSSGASSFRDHSLVHSGMPLPAFFMGTATQWNEDYAVTARHIPLVKKVVYRCEDGCDLVFIKRKAKGKTPEWREPVPGKKVYRTRGESGNAMLDAAGL